MAEQSDTGKALSGAGSWGQQDLKCTIVIPAYGDPEMTDRCLQSIGELAGVHLVLIDQEGTWDRWRALSGKPDSRIEGYAPLTNTTVVRTRENVGAVRATNIGFQLAMLDTSPFILRLDNDIEIPEGDKTWLDRWLAHFTEDPDVAAAGAVTDWVSGRQAVQQVHQRYTKDWQAQPVDGEQTGAPGAGEAGPVTVPWLISFACMYRKDALIQMPSPNVTMGDIVQKRACHIYHFAHLWDERFSPGQWEDIDLSIRLTTPWRVDSRWKLVVAQDVYLHHHCHQAFKAIGGFQELLERNIRKGCEKWTTGLVANLR